MSEPTTALPRLRTYRVGRSAHIIIYRRQSRQWNGFQYFIPRRNWLSSSSWRVRNNKSKPKCFLSYCSKKQARYPPMSLLSSTSESHITYPYEHFLLGQKPHIAWRFLGPSSWNGRIYDQKNARTNRGCLEIVTMPQNMIRALKMLDGSFIVTALLRGLRLSNTMGSIDPARKCRAWQRCKGIALGHQILSSLAFITW